MDAAPLPLPETHQKETPLQGNEAPSLLPEEQLLPHFIRAEANLLRLPLFALNTKGLKTLDGIECTGRITRDGQTHQFSFRATRNTATLYPGPLARSAHLAFLSIMTEQGLPLQNPLCWGWRDLCRRMRVTYGGQMVQHLKEAIKATALLGIQSNYALYSKTEGQLLHSHQDALHLYERVTFVGTPLLDGTIADTNYLWLSDWYLSNLNALYSAPLDYELWRHLDERSPIASRLYEFVLINFHSGTPVLRINYETLVQFLPVTPERYRSQAVQQLEPALTLLCTTGVLSTVQWDKGERSIAQLRLYRGPQLTHPDERNQTILPFLDEDFTGSVKVRELRNLKPPVWHLVADFYRLWLNAENVHPTKKEVAQANDVLTAHGEKKAKALIPLVVQVLREQWPEAKSFGAALRYLPEACAKYDRQQHVEERRKQEQLQEKQERETAARRATERAALKQLLQSLPGGEREEIQKTVLAKQPPSVTKYPGIVENFCLEELARRQRQVDA